MIKRKGFASLFKKDNRFLVKILLVIFFMTIFSSANGILAYDSSNYNSSQTVKIGLESMFSDTMSVTINGDYKVNSTLYSSGTSFQLTKSNGKVALNGVEVASLNFVSQKTGNTISISSGQSTLKYLGDMSFQVVTLRGTSSIGILPINSINVEDYLKGVVAIEMYSTYNIEALKAQAVAARNYALANVNKYSSYGYGLNDTTDCQAYAGYNAALTNVNSAVDQTRGVVLLYNGSLIEANYSASNGGYTEDCKNVWGTAFPFYVSKPDSFDPLYPWTRVYTSAEIETALKSHKTIPADSKFISLNTANIKTYESGRVSYIEIIYQDVSGVQNTVTLSQDPARTKFYLSSSKYLPSSMYSVSYNASSDTYTFTGKGFGHGVGMSQMAANARANSGLKYNEILSFYYVGTEIKNLLLNGQVGWILISNKWYYILTNGLFATNLWEQDSSRQWYYLGSTGAMVTNRWAQDSSRQWFYLGANGAMVTNRWAQDSSRQWFYLGTNGAMVTNRWAQDSSKRWYYLGSSGAMVVNTWVLYNGKKYYLSADGSMVTGWKLISGKWYYFYSSGALR